MSDSSALGGVFVDDGSIARYICMWKHTCIKERPTRLLVVIVLNDFGVRAPAIVSSSDFDHDVRRAFHVKIGTSSSIASIDFVSRLLPAATTTSDSRAKHPYNTYLTQRPFLRLGVS